MNEKIFTIMCVDRWQYHGSIVDQKLSPFGSLLWLKIQTPKGRLIKINSEYIVAILENDCTKKT